VVLDRAAVAGAPDS